MKPKIRPEKREQLDKYFLDSAWGLTALSHCQCLQVGAVIALNDHSISTGYNGTTMGATNCDDIFPIRNDGSKEWEEKYRNAHHKFSGKYEIHAEMNAIIFAARNGIKIEGATLYCTHQPCADCLKNICQSGIKRVVYDKPYDKVAYDDMTRAMIKVAGIKLEQKTYRK
jgi:dCMP deaminase